MRCPFALGALALAVASAPATVVTNAAPRTLLRAAVPRQGDSATLGGAMQHPALATGEISEFLPPESHRASLRTGDFHVACADPASRGGAPRGGDVRVTHVDRQAPVEQGHGKVVRLA